MAKKKRGDRKDGVWLKDIPAMNRIMPTLLPNRADNEAHITVDIDLRPMNDYLEKLNKGRTEDKYTFFHLVSAAIGKAFILRPKMNPENAPVITFCCALAMSKAVRQVTGLDAQIKWPNDLVLGGKKLCGILLEMGFDAQGFWVVAGTGLNVRHAAYPPELAHQATSIEEHGDVPDRGAIVAAYLGALEDALDAVERDGFAGIATDFRRVCITLGSPVHVLGAESFTGVAEAIDDTGALLVRDDAGMLRRVLSGDVSVRGVMGYV